MIVPMCVAALTLAQPAAFQTKTCSATCAVVQSGPTAESEINAKKRSYRTKFLLVDVVGRVEGKTLAQLRNRCVYRARDKMWWKPTGDRMTAILARTIDVDESDGVRAVRYVRPVNSCVPQSSYEYFLESQGFSK